MLDFFKLIFHIECFIVPISAGLLSYAYINGKKSKRKFLLTFLLSSGILLISFIGVYVNSPDEIRQSMRDNFVQSISFEE